jgi:signal transduction histidine kinase
MLLRPALTCIEKKWILEKAEYDFFASKTTQTIEQILSTQESLEGAVSYKNDVQTLKDKETAQRDKTERLLAFQENAPSELAQVYSQNSEQLSSSLKRIDFEIGGRSYLASLFQSPAKDDGQSSDLLGFLIDQDFLKTGVIKNILQQHVASNKTGWIVRGKNGESLLASETIPSDSIEIQTYFAGSFPDWRIDLYRQDPRLFETLLTSRRGVYFFIFLLIGGILIFGLFLTIRSVSQELELSRMKSDFVSTISHEFKSPLTSIRQLAEMLQSGRVASEEKRQKYYDVLVEQSERLSLLTENVLSFARMEEGRKDFKFEPVDIASVLEDIVSTIQERVRHDGFELELKIEQPLSSIKADSPAFTQAVNNLIDNAIKYSGESKRIFVSAEEKDQHLVLSVRDFGRGIKEEEQVKVFERFYRGGDELTRTVKGSGLGLTLVKQIVEAHKGSVQVESELGRGSTFSIKLPFDQPKEK